MKHLKNVMTKTLFALLFVAGQLMSVSADAFDCSGTDLDVRVAKEFLKYFECGGMVRGGLGECLDPANFDLIYARTMAPQGESFPFYQMRADDKLKFVSVAVDEIESVPERDVDVRKVTFDVVHARGKSTPFTFLYTMRSPAKQKYDGCAVMRSPPESQGKKYIFVGKPFLE